MKTSTQLSILIFLQFGLQCQGQLNKFQTSVYDDPKYESVIERQRKSLKGLDDNEIFDKLQSKILPNLPKKHQEYFKSNSALKLISSKSGDIYSNNKTDFAFVVFDRNNIRISVIIYNELTNKYKELYRGIKVLNNLLQKDCYHSAFRTLDYQIGNEIIYSEDLRKDYNKFKWEIIKITNITKDKDFVISKSCNAINELGIHANVSNSLCISTSFVYNNWECLKYDKEKDLFILYYRQAFAD
jgi:hypothetical protein